MRIHVDQDRCEGYGFCEEAAPALMRLDDDGTLELLVGHVPRESEAAAREAVKACPVAALRVEGTASDG